MGAFASGKHALAICDRCGTTCKLRELKRLVNNNQLTGLKVCGDCWEPDHPLNSPPLRTADAEALFEPRPDERSADLRNIAWGWKPVYGMEAVGSVGTVTVQT